MNKIVKLVSNVPAVSNTLPDISSFGGRSLVENVKMADNAIAKMEPLQRIWNHSHSTFMWKHLTIPAFGHMRCMRQIASEMASRKSALQESRCELNKDRANLDIMKRDKENCEPLDAAVLQAEIEAVEGKAQMKLTYIEGGLKDVLILEKMYDRMIDRHGQPGEAGFEKVEAEAHIRRSLSQCLRDLRNMRSIGKGEQQYLEQLGINPGKVIIDLLEYLDIERDSDDYSTQGLNDFLDGIVEKLLPCISIAEKLSGFEDLDIEDVMYKEYE